MSATAEPKAPAPGAAPEAPAAPSIGLRKAMEIARDAAALFSELRVDAVVSCERQGEGWRVTVDVIEARARIGDNDLLATYELLLDPTGDCERFTRLRRYHREDGAA